MFRSARSFSLGAVVAAALVNPIAAQEAAQTLKDAWVATPQTLLDVSFDGSAPVVRNPDDAARNFQAIAFEAPKLGSAGVAARPLIAVDGTKLIRYEDGVADVLFDAGNAPSSLKYVTTIAVADDGAILFSGYSKPKRVFELWMLTEPGGTPLVTPVTTGTPQLLDSVFVRDDAAAGAPFSDGGLLATAAKQVLFFRKTASGYAAPQLLLDAKALGLKGATELTSADLVRETNRLMVATTERKLLSAATVANTVVTQFATIPAVANCTVKPQRILVRNADAGSAGSSFVSDACGRVLLYDFSSLTVPNTLAPAVVSLMTGPVALAVGEGNEVTCPPNGASCPLISNAFTAFISAQSASNLLVLQYPDLCDPRVVPTCSGETSAGTLKLNSLLPTAVQTALKGVLTDPTDDVVITIPPYLFAAGFNGRFGVVFVQADDNAAAAAATIELDIAPLVDNEFELGVDVGLPRPTAILDLLNQDVAAYAPDNPSLRTVRGFEATPITVGVRNPMIGALRGFSVIIYGLQHDLNPPTGVALPRDATGGLPAGTPLTYGSQRLCALSVGSQSYTPIDDPTRYFMNLAACLFADQETLLNTVVPAAAFDRPSDRSALISSLNQVEDKLIKALSGAGPNTGSETFQALITQLNQFDATLAAAPFDPLLVIYKNELQVRSRVLRFNVLERTYPSLPTNGF